MTHRTRIASAESCVRKGAGDRTVDISNARGRWWWWWGDTTGGCTHKRSEVKGVGWGVGWGVGGQVELGLNRSVELEHWKSYRIENK